MTETTLRAVEEGVASSEHERSPRALKEDSHPMPPRPLAGAARGGVQGGIMDGDAGTLAVRTEKSEKLVLATLGLLAATSLRSLVSNLLFGCLCVRRWRCGGPDCQEAHRRSAEEDENEVRSVPAAMGRGRPLLQVPGAAPFVWHRLGALPPPPPPPHKADCHEHLRQDGAWYDSSGL